MTTNNRKNEYRIYIRSNEHPRTINTPKNGRTYYSIVTACGLEDFTAKLNELIAKGEKIIEVRKGYGGFYVKYWEHIAK